MKEETKQKLRDNLKKAREAKMSKYATKDDLNKVLEAITQIAQTVNDLANKPPVVIEKTTQEIPGTADMSKVKESAVPSDVPDMMKGVDMKKVEEGGFEKMPVPPAWRKMVDEILGLDFGIDVVYPQSGSGFLFKLIVPKEKSNASEAYKEFNRTDIRTKAVSYSDGVDGIRKFCELVKINLSKK